MKSKIRIEYDFEKKEPYLEIRMPAHAKTGINDRPDSGITPDESPDLRDSMLKNFIQEYDLYGKQLVLQYPENNTDNSVVRIYLQETNETPQVAAAAYMPRVVGGFTRRSQIQLLTPVELAIYTTMQETEKLGAHPALTDVINLLSQARERLADWVENCAEQIDI